MKIKTPQNSADYEKLDAFFGTIWKEEFDLNAYNEAEEYKLFFVFFIEENEKIISAIIFRQKEGKWKIGGFGTAKSHRNQGIGSKLLNAVLEFLQSKNVKEVFLKGEITKVPFYEKFGFQKIGEPQPIGNTQSVEMKKEL